MKRMQNANCIYRYRILIGDFANCVYTAIKWNLNSQCLYYWLLWCNREITFSEIWCVCVICTGCRLSDRQRMKFHLRSHFAVFMETICTNTQFYFILLKKSIKAFGACNFPLNRSKIANLLQLQRTFHSLHERWGLFFNGLVNYQKWNFMEITSNFTSLKKTRD